MKPPYIDLSRFPFVRRFSPTLFRVEYGGGHNEPSLVDLRVQTMLDSKPYMLPMNASGMPSTSWPEPFRDAWAPVVPTKFLEQQRLEYVEQVGGALVWRRRTWKKKIIPSALAARVELALRAQAEMPKSASRLSRTELQEAIAEEMRRQAAPSIKDDLIVYQPAQRLLWIFTQAKNDVSRLTTAWKGVLRALGAEPKLFGVDLYSFLDSAAVLRSEGLEASTALFDALGRAALDRRLLLHTATDGYTTPTGRLELADEASIYQRCGYYQSTEGEQKSVRYTVKGEGADEAISALLDKSMEDNGTPEGEAQGRRHLSTIDLLLFGSTDEPLFGYRLGAGGPAMIEGGKIGQFDRGESAETIWSDRLSAALWELESGYRHYFGIIEATIRAYFPEIRWITGASTLFPLGYSFAEE